MERQLFDEIKMLENILTRIFINQLNKSDLKITPVQGCIICYLIKNENTEVYQKDIEKLFSIRRSTTSEILNIMEKNNLIKRILKNGTLKKRIIVLTDEAKLKHKKIEELSSLLESNLKKDITYDELYTFFSVIDKIKNNIERMIIC